MTKEQEMPMPAESLNKDSSPVSIREAIGKTIEMCMKEGKSQKECAGMAYSMAREHTGKDMMEGKAR